MVEIKLFSRTIHQLTYGELFEFLLAIIESTEPFIAGVSRLQIRYDALKGVFVIYDDGFKRPLTAPETEEIKAFDTQRKGVFILVDDSVRKNAHYSVIAEVKAAAHALLPIFENYAGTPKIEYEGETAAVVNLLQELHKPENVTRIPAWVKPRTSRRWSKSTSTSSRSIKPASKIATILNRKATPASAPAT